MLKGHIFKKQAFGNQVFAYFINTFLNGKNGMGGDYGNGMNLIHTNTTITIQDGICCIQGRFLEEDSGTTIAVDSENMYCSLVIEIDLDKQNTESEFVQGSYKIVKSTNDYPILIKNNIVKNNSGVYQYEIARFRTGINGISEFQDKRTFLDLKSIYDEIEKENQEFLNEFQEKIHNVENGSAYLMKNGGTADGNFTFNGRITANNINNNNRI